MLLVLLRSLWSGNEKESDGHATAQLLHNMCTEGIIFRQRKKEGKRLFLFLIMFRMVSPVARSGGDVAGIASADIIIIIILSSKVY